MRVKWNRNLDGGNGGSCSASNASNDNLHVTDNCGHQDDPVNPFTTTGHHNPTSSPSFIMDQETILTIESESQPDHHHHQPSGQSLSVNARSHVEPAERSHRNKSPKPSSHHSNNKSFIEGSRQLVQTLLHPDPSSTTRDKKQQLSRDERRQDAGHEKVASDRMITMDALESSKSDVSGSAFSQREVRRNNHPIRRKILVRKSEMSKIMKSYRPNLLQPESDRQSPIQDQKQQQSFVTKETHVETRIQQQQQPDDSRRMNGSRSSKNGNTTTPTATNGPMVRGKLIVVDDGRDPNQLLYPLSFFDEDEEQEDRDGDEKRVGGTDNNSRDGHEDSLHHGSVDGHKSAQQVNQMTTDESINHGNNNGKSLKKLTALLAPLTLFKSGSSSPSPSVGKKSAESPSSHAKVNQVKTSSPRSISGSSMTSPPTRSASAINPIYNDQDDDLFGSNNLRHNPLRMFATDSRRRRRASALIYKNSAIRRSWHILNHPNHVMNRKEYLIRSKKLSGSSSTLMTTTSQIVVSHPVTISIPVTRGVMGDDGHVADAKGTTERCNSPSSPSSLSSLTITTKSSSSPDSSLNGDQAPQFPKTMSHEDPIITSPTVNSGHNSNGSPCHSASTENSKRGFKTTTTFDAEGKSITTVERIQDGPNGYPSGATSYGHRPTAAAAENGDEWMRKTQSFDPTIVNDVTKVFPSAADVFNNIQSGLHNGNNRFPSSSKADRRPEKINNNYNNSSLPLSRHDKSHNSNITQSVTPTATPVNGSMTAEHATKGSSTGDGRRKAPLATCSETSIEFIENGHQSAPNGHNKEFLDDGEGPDNPFRKEFLKSSSKGSNRHRSWRHKNKRIMQWIPEEEDDVYDDDGHNKNYKHGFNGFIHEHESFSHKLSESSDGNSSSSDGFVSNSDTDSQRDTMTMAKSGCISPSSSNGSRKKGHLKVRFNLQLVTREV